MLSSIAESSLVMAKWLVLGSLLGCISYAVVYWIRTAEQLYSVIGTFVATWLAVLTILYSFVVVLFSVRFSTVITGLGVCVLICAGGAFSERAIGVVESSWSGHFTALLCATLLACGITICLRNFTPLLDEIRGTTQVAGFHASLIATPSAIATFLWMWRSSWTRPGIDRPLHAVDEVNGVNSI